MNDSLTKLVNLTFDGTTLALGEILKSKGLDPASIGYGRIASTIKAVLKANIQNIFTEWQKAVEANLSELWIRELLKAQCAEMAQKAMEIL